ncbi:hypothetical protein [Aerosticca soli]|jgi:hypothetical protein|uniref:Uncharacterized protein n=1 Tax=Aerosticca soli TaxID=2010829 RepID=A0A2Z6E4Z5_9GAMM|nr:hypothetical protein [Aerosticca soli]MDI3261919.1 hypothetical protein [Fulvimonas sp.]BBD79618.1 hypothetical protein ALSL_0954 [Aerosticca soli]
MKHSWIFFDSLIKDSTLEGPTYWCAGKPKGEAMGQIEIHGI